MELASFGMIARFFASFHSLTTLQGFSFLPVKVPQELQNEEEPEENEVDQIIAEQVKTIEAICVPVLRLEDGKTASAGAT